MIIRSATRGGQSIRNCTAKILAVQPLQIYVFRIYTIFFSAMVAFDKLCAHVKSQTRNSLIWRCYVHLFDGEPLFLYLILNLKKVSFVIRCFERFSSYANSNYKDWAESLFLAVNFGPRCDSVFYKNLFLDLYNAPDMKSLNGLNVQLGIFFLLCSGNKNSGDCQYPLLFYIEPSSGGDIPIYFTEKPSIITI